MRGKQLTSRPPAIKTARIREPSRIRLAVNRVQALRKRDYIEDLAIWSDAGLVILNQKRKRLLVALVAGLLTTSLIWIVSLSFPLAASKFFWIGANLESKLLTVLVMSIPFTPPFVTVFALSNLLFPSVNDPNIAVGLMSTFAYTQTSNRRWLIIIVSGMSGALNCLLLFIALSSRIGN